ncbi:MAG TPA: nitroreductase/quinone reductase family protein [Candidatus Limnocylindrales bacterium]|jgi:deazaflavin-dependent oxidoreductase (nitroreductase family)|nr:nitroreductase/quinone reductase family protein [Candidatus Limnocylindrales bacterium]
MPDTEDFEEQLIAEMRANDGKVVSGPLAGHPLLIMTSSGAKTGMPRRAILTYHRDGDDYLVAGTASGSPTTPGWVHNVQADPAVALEVGNERLDAMATIVEGAERDRLWDDHVRALPWFADYPAQSGRVIPMIRLTPRA